MPGIKRTETAEGRDLCISGSCERTLLSARDLWNIGNSSNEYYKCSGNTLSAGLTTMGEISTRSGSQVFTVLLWTALSIAMVIIGSMHVDNCPVEPKIPIYLIVAGVFHLVAFALLPLKLVGDKLAYAIESIMALFSFCWFIAGSVWVFRIYQDNPRRCNDLVYKFAFGILIFEYIFLAFLVAVICLCTCCAGCLGLMASETTIETHVGEHSPEDVEALK
ncbi:transmembrane protein 272-like isoform X2 [Pseudophryne corroboree]|uniref:transmembrane protein 272-like isoform X2 n=1 Tax=Pseudophryne corroboree TaxID=495146 RepID=UPI003081B111